MRRTELPASERALLHLSIVIPAWNEANRIRATLKNLIDYFSDADDEGAFEIVVVTDGSNDETRDIVLQLAKSSHQVRALHYPRRLGKGEALKRGIMASRGSRIALADADGSSSPEQIHKLLELTGSADVVVGSRWVDGSSGAIQQPLIRRLAGRGFNGLVRLLLQIPIRDTQCGYKAFRADSVKSVLPQVSVGCYVFDVDLIWKLYRKGYTILEVPLSWSHKEDSKIRMGKVAPMMGLTLLGLRLVNSRIGTLLGRKWFYRIYALVRRLE